MDTTKAVKENVLVDFIDMLVTRLTNVEDEFSKYKTYQNEQDIIREHEDNMKDAGTALSGLRHCDPPRDAMIVKHYRDLDDYLDEHEHYIMITFRGPGFYSRKGSSTRVRKNDNHDADMKEIFGDEYETVKKFIDNGKREYPYSEQEDYNMFNYLHEYPEEEICEKLVKYKFPCVKMYGYGGVVVKHDSVRNMLKLMDDIDEYLYGSDALKRNKYHLWYVGDFDEELLQVFIGYNDCCIADVWFDIDDDDKAKIRKSWKNSPNDIAHVIYSYMVDAPNWEALD